MPTGQCLPEEKCPAIRHLTSGNLSLTNLKQVKFLLKRLKSGQFDECGAHFVVACIGSLTAALQNAIFWPENLELALKHSKHIKFISKTIGRIIKKYKDTDFYKPQSGQNPSVPINHFACTFLPPSELRDKQLELLKAIILDTEPKCSPLAILVFSRLLKQVTEQEFDQYVYPHLLRRLRRNNKPSLWHACVIFKYTDAKILAGFVSEIVSVLHDYVTDVATGAGSSSNPSANVLVVALPSVELRHHGKVYNRNCSLVASKAIQYLSKTFAMQGLCSTCTVFELLSMFKQGGALGVTEQEKCMASILLLIPNNVSEVVKGFSSSLVDEFYQVLCANAKSSTFEGVKIKFITLIGVLVKLTDNYKNLNEVLVDVMVDLTKVKGKSLQSKDVKLNVPVLEAVLKSLKVGGCFKDPRICKAVSEILEYTAERPAYKMCCFEALHLLYMYGDDNNGSINGIGLVTDGMHENKIESCKGSVQFQPASVLLNFTIQGQELLNANLLLSYLHIVTLWMGNGGCIEMYKDLGNTSDKNAAKQWFKVSCAQQQAARVDLVYKNILDVMEALYERYSCCKSCNSDNDDRCSDVIVTGCNKSWDSNPIDDVMFGHLWAHKRVAEMFDDFERVLKTTCHHGNLLGMLLEILNRRRGGDFASSLGLLKIIAKSILEMKLPSTHPLNIALADVVTHTGNHCDAVDDHIVSYEFVNLLLPNQAVFKALKELKVEQVPIDEETLFHYIVTRLSNSYHAGIVHYICAKRVPCASLVPQVLDIIQDAVLDEMQTLHCEDFRIYMAPTHCLYDDPRPYQPFLNPAVPEKERKKFATLTRQQLDEMRYQEQCHVRQKVATLVSKYLGSILVLSHLSSASTTSVLEHTERILMLLKLSVQYECLGGVALHFLNVYCPKLVPREILSCNHKIALTLFNIYRGRTDAEHTSETLSLVDEFLATLLEDRADAFPPSASIVFMQIIDWALMCESATHVTRQLTLCALLLLLERRCRVDLDQLMDLLQTSSRDQRLDQWTRLIFNEAAEYLLTVESLPEVCQIGLTSRVELVTQALDIFKRNVGIDACHEVAHCFRVFGILDGIDFNVEKVVELIPTYCWQNEELRDLVAGCLVEYPDREYVISRIFRCYDTFYPLKDDTKEVIAVLNLLGLYLKKVGEASWEDAYMLFRSLLDFVKPQVPIVPLFECSVALVGCIGTGEKVLDFLYQCKELLLRQVLKAEGQSATETSNDEADDSDHIASLSNSDFEHLKNTKLACGLITMGYLGDLLREDDVILQWALKMMLKLSISPYQPFTNDVHNHHCMVLTKLTRKYILRGQGEHAFVYKQIETLFEKSLVNSTMIKPFVSLLRGVGLVGIKDHKIVGALKSHLTCKKLGNEVKKNNAVAIIQELNRQYGQLFEPFIAEVLDGLISVLGVVTDAESTAMALLKLTTPVSLKLVLPHIFAGMNKDKWQIKAGSLNLLGALICKENLRLAIIRNISQMVDEVSRCSTDSSKQVRAAVQQVLDCVSQLVPPSSLTLRIIEPVVAALALPNEERLGAFANAIYELHLKANSEADTTPISIAELGLVHPSLMKLFKSRSGTIRERAVIASGWLASKCDSLAQVEFLVTSIISPLVPLLKDPLPNVREETSKAIGSCAKRFEAIVSSDNKDQQHLALPACMQDLINTLLNHLTASTTSMERCSVACGLAEALQAADEAYTDKIVEHVVDLISNESSTPQTREGGLALIVHLSGTRTQYIILKIEKILHVVLTALDDADGRVRDMGYTAAKVVIEAVYKDHFDVLFKHFKNGIKSSNWQIRNGVLLLLDHLNRVIGGNFDVQVEMFLCRSDVNDAVKETAQVVWKGVNVTRSLRQFFPKLLVRIVEMLQGGMEQCQIASDCMCQVIQRLGKEAVDLFVSEFINPPCTDGSDGIKSTCSLGASLSDSSKCIGLKAVIAAVKDATMLKEHIGSIIDFLKVRLCSLDTRDEASKTLAAFAHLFPLVVTEMVIPAILENLNTDDRYMLGLECLMESNSECFQYIAKSVLSKETSPMNLTLLVRVMCCCKGKLIVNKLPLLDSCIDHLLLYGALPATDPKCTFHSAVDSIVAGLSGDSTIKMTRIVIDKLHERVAARTKENFNSNVLDCNNLLVFVNALIQGHQVDLESKLYDVTASLGTLIYAQAHLVATASQVLDSLVKVAERRGHLEELIYAIESTLVKEIDLVNFENNSILDSTMGLIQKVLLRCSGSGKASAATCIGKVCTLVDKQRMGTFCLRIIGALIRTLNEKCAASLKELVLKAISQLLTCDLVHIKAIVAQLQSTLIKCINDPSPSVTSLVPQNIKLLVSLVPAKADSIIGEMLNIAGNVAVPNNTRSVAIESVYSILTLDNIHLENCPMDALVCFYKHHSPSAVGSSSSSSTTTANAASGSASFTLSGNDKQFIAKSIGLAASHSQDSWPCGWLDHLISSQTSAIATNTMDAGTILILKFVCSSAKGFQLCSQFPEFGAVVDAALSSEIPSVSLAAIELYSEISKVSTTCDDAKEFMVQHFHSLPDAQAQGKSAQATLLQCYQRILSHARLVGYSGSMAGIVRSIVETSMGLLYSCIPMVKLEAENVVMLLLDKRGDVLALKKLADCGVVSAGACKVLTEYSERVLLKARRLDV